MTPTAPSLTVAAVIPARDGLPFVLDAVASVLAQRLVPEEIIVVDDASTDGTGDAVEERYLGPGAPRTPVPVRVVRGSFGSPGAARNAGWRAATAPWVAFLDADDLWYPEKLMAAAEALSAVPQAEWFFSDGAFLGLDGTLRASWLASYAELPEPYAGQPVAELIEVNFILTSSVVVRRSLLESLGGFAEDMSHAEDLDLWIRMARRAPATASRRGLVRYQHRHGGLTQQVHARLQGDVDLFRRLSADSTLTPELRRRAAKREALAHFKLAYAELREGRAGAARRHLANALRERHRTLPAMGLWIASLLPTPVFGMLRRRAWGARHVVIPALSPTRVALRPEPALLASAARRRAS